MFFISRVDGTKDFYKIEGVKGSKEKESEEEKKKKKEEKRKSKAEKITALVANDVMSRSTILSGEETLDRAWDLIKEQNFQSLPVISKEGKLVGILKGKDVMRALEKNEGKRQVSDIMKTDVIAASGDTEVKEMAQLFFDKRVKMLPIIDQQSRVLGVVTQGDLLETMIKVSRLR